jgi:hypothetical protein
MEPERVVPKLPAAVVTDADREHATELLQRACGEGRLTLDEFSVRAGAVWAADSHAELADVTAGLAEPPPVGSNQPVLEMSAVFGEHKQRGKWRLPRVMRVRAVFGSMSLDLRQATIGADSVDDGVVDIHVRVLFGECKITVPEGVEVEMYGRAAFGSRDLRLAPVPRRAGTPVVRIHSLVWFGELKVRSAQHALIDQLPGWLRRSIGDYL